MDLRRSAGTFEHYLERDRRKRNRGWVNIDQMFGKWTEAEARKWVEPLHPVLTERSFADSDNETTTLRSCLHQVISHEAQHSLRYKWLMRVRPDLLHNMRMPPYELWPTWLEDRKVKQLFTSDDMRTANWVRGGGCNKGGNWALMTRSAARGYFEPWPSEKDIHRRCLTSATWGKDECRLGCALHIDKVHVAGCANEQTVGEILRGHMPNVAKLRNLTDARLRSLVDARAATAPVFEFQCVEYCNSNASYARNVTFGQEPWMVLPRYGRPTCAGG